MEKQRSPLPLLTPVENPFPSASLREIFFVFVSFVIFRIVV